MLGTAACSGASDTVHDAGILLVTSGFTDEVMVLDATNGDVLERHSLDVRRAETDEPHGVTVSPDGRHWYATVAHGSPTLWKFDGLENRLVGRLELPTHGASRIGIDPSGRWGWVPDYWRSGQGADGQVAAIDLVTLEVRSANAVCPAPHDAQVDPQGTLVAVTCAFSDEIVLLDATSADEVVRTRLEGASDVAGEPAQRPMNAVWSSDGATLYVTLMGVGQVVALDRAGLELERAPVGANPAQLVILPAGDALLVANRGDMSASRVGLDGDGAFDQVERIPLPGADHPHAVALNDGGTVAYLTYEGTTRSRGGVVALDLATRAELWRAEVGTYTLGVAWSRSPNPQSR